MSAATRRGYAGAREIEVSSEELMTVAASRLLADNRVVFAGVGAPLVASAMARRLQAPNLTIVLEGGIIGTQLRAGQLPVSTNEMRAGYGASMFTDITDVFLYAQRGFFDYGFLGAAQVDCYGNINTSFIGDPEAPRVRLPGSGARTTSSRCATRYSSSRRTSGGASWTGSISLPVRVICREATVATTPDCRSGASATS